MVPRLMLQPVVENAVQHGMRVNRCLHVQVNAFREDDGIRIVVKNDGHMPDEATCLLVNERLLQSDAESNHIGLRNLQERICLRYGADYGIALSVDRSAGMTSVMIRLPYTEAARKEAQHVPLADR